MATMLFSLKRSIQQYLIPGEPSAQVAVHEQLLTQHGTRFDRDHPAVEGSCR
jgi:hypothetical protein